MSKKSDLRGNLKLLLKIEGGVWPTLRSGYFAGSLILCALMYQHILHHTWANTALAVLPSLAGFSLASFAIYFAITSESQRIALLKRTTDDETPPLLEVLSIVIKAVVFQITTLTYAFVFQAKPFSLVVSRLELAYPVIEIWVWWGAWTFSALGLLLVTYSLVLVLGVALSLLKFLDILSRS